MIGPLLALVLAAPITLDEVRAASRQNLEALKAEIELKRQQLGVTVAKAAIWPQLSVSSQAQGRFAGPARLQNDVPIYDPVSHAVVGFEQQTGDIDASTTRATFNLSVQVSQLIYDGGRWWNQIAQAGGAQRAAQGQLDEQRLASELEAVSRYYQLLTAQVAVNVFENAVKRSESQVDRATSLYEAGRAAKLDAIDAAVNLGNDRINLLRQRQSVTAAQVELLKWLGQPTREVEVADFQKLDAAPAPAPALDQALTAARAHRPLLKALEAQVDVAQSGVDLGWAPYLPTVSLVGGYQRQAPSDPFFTDLGRNNVLYGGLNLSWNVFNGFGTQAQLDQARETLAQAKLQRERAELDLAGDLRRAIKALDTQLQVVVIATENLELSESALKLAEERFTAGAGSTLEVRDAQVKLTSSQLNRLQARVDVEVARAALERVIGADVEEHP